MSKVGIALFISVFLACTGMTACAQEKSLSRIVSERLVARIDFSSWIAESLKVSPDSQQVAYAAQAGDKVLVVVDKIEGEQYDTIIITGGGKITLTPSIDFTTLV